MPGTGSRKYYNQYNCKENRLQVGRCSAKIFAMDDLKLIIASNIINLRTDAGMSQAELAEKINYSDKSVSKWERGESLPDILTLKTIGDIFNVDIAYMTSEHNEWDAKVPEPKPRVNTLAITELAMVSVLTLSLIVFIGYWINGQYMWVTFPYTITVELILLLVLHSVWQKGKYNYYIIAALVLSVILNAFFTIAVFFNHIWWQILLLAIPGELIVYLCSRIVDKKSDKSADKN